MSERWINARIEFMVPLDLDPDTSIQERTRAAGVLLEGILDRCGDDLLAEAVGHATTEVVSEPDHAK